jgi:hypothetical protein
MPAARPRLSGNHFSGADTRHDHAEIVAVERGGFGVDRPAYGAEDAADQHDDARAVFVDEPALDRDQPGLEQYEQREGPLDRSAIPAEFLLDVGDEERPAILVIGDHNHRADADGQLRPSIGVANPGRCGGRAVNYICHSFSPKRCSIRSRTAGSSLVYDMPVDKRNIAILSHFRNSLKHIGKSTAQPSALRRKSMLRCKRRSQVGRGRGGRFPDRVRRWPCAGGYSLPESRTRTAPPVPGS